MKRTAHWRGHFGRGRYQSSEFLRALRGDAETAGMYFEPSGRLRDGPGNLADHPLEVARQLVHSPAPFDLHLRVACGLFVRASLGNQCFLEDLECVRHRADFRFLPAMRNLYYEISFP